MTTGIVIGSLARKIHENLLRLENSRSFTRFTIFILDRLSSMPAGENRSNFVKYLRFSASRYGFHEFFGLARLISIRILGDHDEG